MKNKTVFICGGHFSPAIAVIEELKKYSNLQLYYLGRKYALEGDEVLSLEYREIKKINLPFLEITTGRLDRFLSWQGFLSLFKIPIGIFQSLKVITILKPDLIISFGGYVALPISIVAFCFKIPVINHEQTRVMGLTNRLVSLFSRYVCLTYSDTKKVPSHIKTYLTGLPVRESIFFPKNTGLTGFGNKRLPLIYITGGSLGSISVNSVVYRIIPSILKKYRVFHVCGESRAGFDYHRLSKLRISLDSKSRNNYFLTPFLENQLVGEAISEADLIISRSGANSVAEVLIHKKKAILIPLPWSANNEQMENALYLRELGFTQIINQEKLTSQSLLNAIEQKINQNNNYLAYDLPDWVINGRQKLAALVLQLLEN